MRSLPQYSKILQDEFKKRKDANHRYSIRAFAKLLNISYATVSLILRGKKGLSQEKARKIAKLLLFTTEESAYFVDLAMAESARSQSERKQARQRLKQYVTRFNATLVDINAFQLISEWYSFPIMELVRIYKNQADASFLAKKLDIPLPKARKTLLALQQLGLMKDGRIISDQVSLPEGPSDTAAQKFHTAILKKALDAVHLPVEERNLTTQIIRMRKSELVKAANKLRESRRALAAGLEEGDDHDSVYSISIQWVRMDREV